MMLRKVTLAGAALLMFAGPALATITVSISPAAQVVPLSTGTTTADIVANIPVDDAITGWGMDLSLLGSSVSIASVAINASLFDAATAADGDDLAALVPFANPAVSGLVTLATITFNLDAIGVTTLTPSDSYPADLSEGFALDPPPVGAFATVDYFVGSIEVTPEPATLALLGLGAVMFARRRA